MTSMDSEMAGSSAAAIARRWWQRYCRLDDGDHVGDRRPRDPAVSARLRRCRSAAEAMCIEPAIQLARQLGAMEQPGSERVEQALGLARVLARVRESSDKAPMRAAGWKSFPGDRSESELDVGERPRLSEARFRRLLQAERGEELVIAFSRLVDLLGGAVNVTALAWAFLEWGTEYQQRRWAFDYYAAAAAAPAADTASASTEAEL